MAGRISYNARVSLLLVVFAFLAVFLVATPARAVLASVSITSSPTGSSVLGQSVTFSATVNGAPTGQVLLLDGSTVFGIVQLNGTGSGSFSTAVLSAGTHTIYANYQGVAFASLSFNVNPRPASVQAGVVPSTAGVGAASMITGIVWDNGNTPPGLGEFSAIGNNLLSLRSRHAAVLLSDGEVLISGGTVAGSPVNTLETFHSDGETFSSVTGNLSQARSGHSATLLSDGITTLITGGDAGGDAELYTYNLAAPETGSSVATGSLQAARSGHTATLLPNGEVLIIGGTVGGSAVSSLEVFDSLGAASSSATGNLAYPRSGHTTTLLSYTGGIATLLVAGGDATGTVELITFDTSSNTVHQVGSAIWQTARTGHTATLLPDGETVLFAGGTGVVPAGPLASAEIYQIPSTLDTFSSFATVPSPNSLLIARSGHTATLLNNTYVLFTGGEADPTQSAEVYTPAFDPLGTIAIASSDPTDTVAPATCTLVLSGTGMSSCSASLTPNAIDGGARSVGVVYTSDGDHVSGEYSNVPMTITIGTQAIVTVTAPANAAYGQTGLFVVASGGSGSGAYSYFAGGSTACTVDPILGALTVTSSTGTCSITATRAGDANYNPSAISAPAIVTINKAASTTSVQSSAPAVMAQNSVTLTAQVSGYAGALAGSVNFMDGATQLGSAVLDNTGTATLTISTLAVGSHSITAVYAGNVTFATSTSSTIIEKVEDFGFTSSGSTVTVVSQGVLPGNTSVYTLQIAPISGSTLVGPVELTLTGAPGDATYTITPATITPGSGVTTFTVTVNSAKQQARISPLPPKGGIGFPKPLVLAIFLPLLGTRKLRRVLRVQMRTSALMLMLLGVLMVTGMTACGSGSGLFTQPAQTYPMTLTGTSGALHHSVTLNLTVQ